VFTTINDILKNHTLKIIYLFSLTKKIAADVIDTLQQKRAGLVRYFYLGISANVENFSNDNVKIIRNGDEKHSGKNLEMENL